MEADKIIKGFPEGLLNWYDFDDSAEILYVSGIQAGLSEMFEERGLAVQFLTLEEIEEDKKLAEVEGEFEYIVATGVIERSLNPEKLLVSLKSRLKSKGKLLLAADNRLGIRYFCGDRDPFTGRNFDGIENYVKVASQDRDFMAGKNYSQSEIRNILDSAGFKNRRFYSVFPCYEAPQLIYAEDYLPAEELAIRYSPLYYYPDSVFLEEEHLCTSLIENGLFHKMANSFLIECPLNGVFSNVNHVTVSMDRNRENILATIIRRDGIAEKRAIYEEGRQSLQNLAKNTKDLQKHGLHVLEGELNGRSYVMPYMKYETAVTYFRRLIRENADKFIQEMDRFRELILQSSDCVKGSDETTGILLKKGYLDLVPLNCFYINGEFVFFDQEFYEENYPANVIIFRSIITIYINDMDLETILPKAILWKRYGLDKNLALWNQKATDFTMKLRNYNQLFQFHEKYQRNDSITNTNREKVNFSTFEYQKLFMDLFADVQEKKIIMFGSGSYAERFLLMFQKEYPVYAILDNNQRKWGTKMENIPIMSPEILKEMNPSEYKVIICVKNYQPIFKQLKRTGAKNIGIYDTNIEYAGKIKREPVISHVQTDKPKKYHVGYISGVFDLFHIGHLNMFRRAKEQCDYLIVGVVTDDGVRKIKKTEPFIAFEERIELVKSCIYVDEAVEIPLKYCDTREAYKMYHFDCQFSGSDYENSSYWLGQKEFLQKQGSDMVFFPYTESTSSSKIKALIEKKLM